MDLSRDALDLWAKRDREGGSGFHPLACHLIDVASVAEVMWGEIVPAGAKRWIARQLGTDPETAGQLIPLWAGMHDLGKASLVFQDRPKCSVSIPHGTISTVALRSLLTEEPFRIPAPIASRLAVIIGGHHGVFPQAYDVDTAEADRHAFGKKKFEGYRRELFDMLPIIRGSRDLEPPAALTNAGGMWIAGFISVVDWIGSNVNFFPFAAPSGAIDEAFDVAAYAGIARMQARTALDHLGWTARPGSTSLKTFSALFPAIKRPNPLQEQVIALADQLTGPALVVIESPMGEGKTEAAFYVADRGNAALGMQGHYIALPTMATSNQMLQRATEFLAARYPFETVQEQLLHGRSLLSPDFDELKTNFASYLDSIEMPADGNLGYGGARPGVVASTWFTQRKRGLLAPFGVGTVDQCLLAVLQTKHVFVRLFGLAGKTVIIDEVHAYDTYMTTLLERLLAWLAALGCTVVVLSATLPVERRERLMDAYRSGLAEPDGCLKDGEDDTLTENTYPLMSWVTSEEAGRVTFGVSERARKRVSLDKTAATWEEHVAEAPGKLAAALENGGCAAVICNTVGRAQEMYLALKAVFPPSELSLLHARFLVEDRQHREDETLRKFGKNRTGRPHRAVLVATQVIEQSLDLDFDLMVTDFAPVDLMLQRSGRLHRHESKRPLGLESPSLWILGPPEPESIPVFDRPVTFVYNEHILLRTWLALVGLDEWAVPDDVRQLVEAIYSDIEALTGPQPGGSAAAWERTYNGMKKLQEDEANEAHFRWIKAPNYEGALWRLASEPLEEDAPDMHFKLQALTRLSEPSVGLIFVARDEPLSTPADKETISQLLLRSVQISGYRSHRLRTEIPLCTEWSQVAPLRGYLPVAFEPSTGVADTATYLRLDRELGVVYTPTD